VTSEKKPEFDATVQIFTGTLIGPHGQIVGRFVRQQDYHNLTVELAKVNRKLDNVHSVAINYREELAKLRTV